MNISTTSARLFSMLLLQGVMVSLCAQADLTGSLLATTNYISGGYSKSDGDPAIQANMDYEHNSGLYTGAWVSSIDFNDGGRDDSSSIEVAPYLGFWYRTSADWYIDTAFTRYLYDDRISGRNSDYNQINVQGYFHDIVGVKVAWSDDFYNRGHTAWDYELLGRYPMTDEFEVSAGLGITDANKIFGYNYWYGNAGVTWFYQMLAVDIRFAVAHEFDEKHVDADRQLVLQQVDNEVILSVSFDF